MEGIAARLPEGVLARMLEETRSGRLRWGVDPYSFNLATRGAGGRSVELEHCPFPRRAVFREDGAAVATLRGPEVALLAEAAEASLNRVREQDRIATRRARD